MAKYIFLLIGIVALISLQIDKLNQFQKIIKITETSSKITDDFRTLHMGKEPLDKIMSFGEKHKKDPIKLLTVNMLWNQFKLEDGTKVQYAVDKIKGIDSLLKSAVYLESYETYKKIFDDIRYFPVPWDETKKADIFFDDSWGNSRTYGGKRTHEGTDIMSSNNKKDYFPVVSVSDGVIEQKGWLEKGGYRIGVRSSNGIYYYYAHLSSYWGDKIPGDTVKAGEVLGYMGDTGYSKIEGTSGKFDVHLHFGIYLDKDGKELSVNPYWILKYIENKKLKFTPLLQ